MQHDKIVELRFYVPPRRRGGARTSAHNFAQMHTTFAGRLTNRQRSLAILRSETGRPAYRTRVFLTASFTCATTPSRQSSASP